MNDADIQPLESQAREYLAQQLGSRAPRELRFEREFAEAPLESEGRTAIFSFDLPPGNDHCAPGASPCHHVAVGQTAPNYSPAYGLDVDDAYSLHIGTVFMLEVGISLAPAEAEPPGAAESVIGFVARQAPETKISDVTLAALFRSEDVYFGLYRARIDGRSMLCVGALPFDRGNQNATPGFYDRADLPPQVVLRLHLGKLIRNEANSAASTPDRT